MFNRLVIFNSFSYLFCVIQTSTVKRHRMLKPFIYWTNCHSQRVFGFICYRTPVYITVLLSISQFWILYQTIHLVLWNPFLSIRQRIFRFSDPVKCQRWSKVIEYKKVHVVPSTKQATLSRAVYPLSIFFRKWNLKIYYIWISSSIALVINMFTMLTFILV